MAVKQQVATSKVECLNPNTGGKMNIDAEIWNLFNKAIRHTLKGKELTFTELVDGINDYLKSNKIKFEKSVGWYAVTIKHDLHAKGAIEVFTRGGKKLHKLKK